MILDVEVCTMREYLEAEKKRYVSEVSTCETRLKNETNEEKKKDLMNAVHGCKHQLNQLLEFEKEIERLEQLTR